MKLAIEILSILAFLLGSPLYVQRFADPVAPGEIPSSSPGLPPEESALLPAD